MPNRRKFLRTVSAASAAGTVANLTADRAEAALPKRDYFKELNVRPIINAAGTYTMFTASLMLPEVMDAINYASKMYVRLNELHDAVGKRIAELLQVEAAMVTAGAASALTVGTASFLTGKDTAKIRQLPNLEGMKTEVIIQKTHRVGYDHAIRNTGVKLIEVETEAELRQAAGPQTAAMFFFNDANNRGQIKDTQFVKLGQELGIPTINDCAADVPPLENLTKYVKMGFSLVVFSGGKGIRGPQSAGLLLGKKEYIEAARLNASPNGDSIGRGMKVNKEEMLGMMAAVEAYLKRDHAAEWKEWERRIAVISDSVRGIASLTTETKVPEIANHVPHLHLKWDQSKIKLTYTEAAKQMREGEPSIEMVPSTTDSLGVGVWMLQPGEEKIVAKRLREVLKAAL